MFARDILAACGKNSQLPLDGDLRCVECDDGFFVTLDSLPEHVLNVMKLAAAVDTKQSVYMRILPVWA